MIAVFLVLVLFAAQDAIAPEVLEAIKNGQFAVLEARFGGQPTVSQQGMLAEAHANFASAQPVEARDAAFRDADKRYRTWTSSVAAAIGSSPEQRDVDTAQAERAHADMILTRWAAPQLDRFALAPPGATDFDRLRQLVAQAAQRSDAAQKRLQPLIDQAALGDRALEEKFLALGIFQRLQIARRQVQRQQAWQRLYLATLPGVPPKERAEHLRLAERNFRALVPLLADEQARASVQVGLARTFRAQQRFTEATTLLKQTLPLAKSFRLAAEIRYEWGRTLVAAEQFEEARGVLRDLVKRDLSKLTEAQQGGRFYISLAQIWDAHSYLLESLKLRRAAAGNVARDSLLQQADRHRASALARFNQLAGRGAEWEDIVNQYLGPHLDKSAEPERLGLAELLFVARSKGRAGDWPGAATLLNEALARKQIPAALLPDLRFEHATALALNGKNDQAARQFLSFVEQHVSHPSAMRAITRAYELQAEIADKSGQPDDYRAVARTLSALLQRFPEHPQRLLATWWAPRALEAAGDFADAARGYGRVPPQSEHWQAAAQRRNLCLLADWNERDRPKGDCPRLARTLVRYAEDPTRQQPEFQVHVHKALLDAAELYALGDQHDAALRTLDHRALRGLAEADAARHAALRLASLSASGAFAPAARLAEQVLQANEPDAMQRVLPLLQRVLNELADRERSGDAEALAGLARDVRPLFQLAEQRLRQTGPPAALEALLFGLARIHLHGGHLDDAKLAIESLVLQGQPSPAMRWWHARILTAQADQPGPEQTVRRQHARRAWGNLLPSLRQTNTADYWEGRYHALRLLKADGEIEQVRQAIEQERIWVPDLGGPPWQARIEALAE